MLKEPSKKEIKRLSEQLSQLQRIAKELEIATVVVVEGWGASGKGGLINDMITSLDPRGFLVYTTKSENEEEARYPFLHRFITKLPKMGEMAIFDRSWYRRVLNDYIDKKTNKENFDNDIEEINRFEKMLVQDGILIVKFFLDVTKKEQTERLEKLLSKSETRWRVSEDDILHNRHYDRYKALFKKITYKTDKEYAPWQIIDANDLKSAGYKMKIFLKKAWEEKIKEKASQSEKKKPSIPQKADSDYLGSVDLTKDISKKDYKKELSFYQKKLFDLQNKLYLKKIPVSIVFEGWDAAGKGGAIKRLSQGMDPRGYKVISTSAPTREELSHHYLWRFWKNVPKTGHIAIFDRSWYGRVMVEPIEGFCSEDEYKRAFDEINAMEKSFYDSGMLIIKFFIHISKDEQLVRFEERKENPLKAWKLTDEDYRNREKWDEYVYTIEKMIEKTSTPYAPWHIVPGNSKKHARIFIIKTVTEAMEKCLEKEEKEL